MGLGFTLKKNHTRFSRLEMWEKLSGETVSIILSILLFLVIHSSISESKSFRSAMVMRWGRNGKKENFEERWRQPHFASFFLGLHFM